MARNAPPSPSHQRVDFVDALRGLAVVFMILWHTADGWLSDAPRSGPDWTAIRLMGGLAAPLFVFLSGVGVSMALGTRSGPGRAKTATRVFWRGLQIVVLGYLLRLQFWALDSLALFGLRSFWICLLILAGWLTVLYAIGLFPYHWLPTKWQKPRRWLALVGCGVAAIGYYAVSVHFDARFKGLLRVDVLHCIGVSVVVVAWVWRERNRAAMSVALGLTVALLTHAMRLAMPGNLPPFVAGYVALFETSKAEAASGAWTLFPIFPWLAYALVGAATGLAWKVQRPAAKGLGLWLLIAVLVGLATYEGLPHAHRFVATTPEGVQPLRVLYRLAWIFGLSALVQALFTFAPKLRLEPIVSIGRTSLLIYWVHLEFAYGIAARNFRKEMNITQWLIGFSFVLLLSYIVAKIRLKKKVAQQTNTTSSKT